MSAEGRTSVGPYAFPLALVLCWPILLYADANTVTRADQHLLGLLTFAFLVLALRASPREERRQVWLLVLVATIAEVLLSVVWGLYRYRWGNVPLFVPPGHGLIFLFVLRMARTSLLARHGRLVVRGALVCGCAWAVAGVTVLPVFGGRLDLVGVALLPLFIVLLRSRAAAMAAVAFFVIAELELIGTALGNWTWAEAAPVTGYPAGNPPAVVSVGYCLLELAALRVAAALPAAPARLGRGRLGTLQSRRVRLTLEPR
ncbi:MAG: hypothetical protein M3271_10055 [Actinomycetota bacterium]|nr:hypothetical protein [Actinomycetota bacterium]